MAKSSSAKRFGGSEMFGILLVRLMVGAVFIMHGYQKLFVFGMNGPSGTISAFHDKMGFGDFSTPAAWAAAIAEFGCGILLALGLFTRLAAIPIIVTMAVAVVKVHLSHGFFLMVGGYEYALTLGIAALGLLMTGSGALGLDNLRGRRS